MIMDFLNSPDHNTILFMLNNFGILIPMFRCPESFKNKISYFIKVEPVEVTVNNYEFVLFDGDISPNPIDDLKSIVENVIIKFNRL